MLGGGREREMEEAVDKGGQLLSTIMTEWKMGRARENAMILTGELVKIRRGGGEGDR